MTDLKWLQLSRRHKCTDYFIIKTPIYTSTQGKWDLYIALFLFKLMPMPTYSKNLLLWVQLWNTMKHLRWLMTSMKWYVAYSFFFMNFSSNKFYYSFRFRFPMKNIHIRKTKIGQIISPNKNKNYQNRLVCSPICSANWLTLKYEKILVKNKSSSSLRIVLALFC